MLVSRRSGKYDCVMDMQERSSLAADTVRHLVELDATMQRATREHDVETLGAMITSDFVLYSSSGRAYDREAFLDDVADRRIQWDVNESYDVAVRLYGDDTAMVTAALHCRYRLDEKTIDTKVRYSDLWIRVDGDWRYACGHASRLAA